MKQVHNTPPLKPCPCMHLLLQLLDDIRVTNGGYLAAPPHTHLLSGVVPAVLGLVPVKDAAHKGGDEGGASVSAGSSLWAPSG